MSTLIIQLPAHRRLSSDPAHAASASGAAAGPGEYVYVLTANGQTVARQGVAPAAGLPKADTVVAVTGFTDVSWQRLPLPRAPSARLRQALGSLLEEQLLDDPEDLHLAVAPQAKAGEPTWVAVCDHTWLTGQLMVLEKAKVRVGRVVPAVWPDAPETAYFHEVHDTPGSAREDGAELMVTWSTTEGVATWPLGGTLARALLPEPLPDGARCFATPAAAAPAERWLGHAVHAQTQAEHLLQAARSMWNLLQFELTPSTKGWQVVADQWRQFLSPQWRPVRAGLLGLVVVQVIGLNLWAWHQQREVKVRRDAITTVLKQAHPQVQVILDAPVQMRRETDSLRALAGQPGEADLETLMQAVAGAWQGDTPSRGLAYDGASLSVALPEQWGEPQVMQFSEALQSAGFAVEQQGNGQVTVRRAARG